ncbi:MULTISPECIES: hypothetical protein [unclassified Legionella]|uniref:hypothetical protein n=1 Tax=unclassified Legionella TaxID=2622702 RepID=UPI00105528EB|nr:MULTISPECIES: hypothetical protein [unclassified Legionella]MDI9817584.1 hypothetical protein [Legionella sp. PL877]
MLSPAHPLQLVFGLIIWSLWFVLMYTVLSVGCAVSSPPASSLTWLNGLLFLTTLISTASLLYLSYKSWRATNSPYPPGKMRRFIIWIGLGVNLIAAAATFSIGLMTLFLPPCL